MPANRRREGDKTELCELEVVDYGLNERGRAQRAHRHSSTDEEVVDDEEVGPPKHLWCT